MGFNEYGLWCQGVKSCIVSGHVGEGGSGGKLGSEGKGVGVVKGWGAWGKYVGLWGSRDGSCGGLGSMGK